VAGTTGDIVQLVLNQLNQSQVQENVHFYRLEDAGTAGYLDGLITQFQADVLPSYEAVQSTEVSYISLVARNIFSGDEVVVSPLDISTGVSSGSDICPSFIAANIKLVRSNARVRHGRKSVGGQIESDMDGQQWETAYVAALQDLANALALPLNPGLADNFKPVIIGRVFNEADPPEHPNDWYSLPTSQVEMGDKWAYVSSGLASPFVSTQRSRKLGHGS